MEIAEAVLCNEVVTVNINASDRLCYPCRVAGEERIILGSTCKFYDTELHDEVVDKLLSLLLSDETALEVALDIDVEECRSTSE